MHHCIQLNAETMQTLEWIELACVHVLSTGKKGRCYVLISSFWQKCMRGFTLKNHLQPSRFTMSTCSLEVSNLRKTVLWLHVGARNIAIIAGMFSIFWQLNQWLVLIYMKVLNSNFFFFFYCSVNSLLSHFWFSDGQLVETVELIFTCLTPKQH